MFRITTPTWENFGEKIKILEFVIWKSKISL